MTTMWMNNHCGNLNVYINDCVLCIFHLFSFPMYRMTAVPSQNLASDIAKVLTSSYAPSGNEGQAEIAENHVAAELFVENVYRQCVNELGQTHAITLEIFLKLFDIWIGLYRLEKCEKELGKIGDQERGVRLIQAWAFLRWKQGDLKEAARLFEEMESMTEPSAALFENLAHTYSSLGEYDKARMYFDKALLQTGGSNKGGILLGIGLLKNRINGERGGLKECLEALEWYQERFSRRGNMSSLEAKCAMSIAKIYMEVGDADLALQYANMAVENFRVTCGNDSPLVASALKLKGDILWILEGDRTNARSVFREAFMIESKKDAIDLVSLIELNRAIVETITKPVPGLEMTPFEIERSEFVPVLSEALTACEAARRKLPHDANLGAFLKIIAELAVWANDLVIAKNLLRESIGLLGIQSSEESMLLISQAKELIDLIDHRIN